MSMPQLEQAKKSFYIWNLIGHGWKIMKENVWELLGLQIALFVIFILLMGLVDLLLPYSPTEPSYVQLANTLADWFIGYCFSLGIITLSLQYADGQPVTFTDFFSKIHLVIKYFVASIVAGLATLIGLICLVIPGIIIATRFSLYGFLIVDKDMGPIEALKASWRLVKGVTWRVLGFFLATLLVTVLGLLCFGIGILFAFPTAAIATALVYRTLLKQS